MTPEQAVFLRDYFANLMESESKSTARVLEAVPNERRNYCPDPKSRTAWHLANHLAQSEVWFLSSIVNGNFAMDPAHESQLADQLGTMAKVVEYYRREFPEQLRRLRAMSGAQLAEPVDFFGFLKEPVVTYLGLANNHGIHHRGQLAAYLRAMGSKVPDIMGGSADEPFAPA